jgi:hypothetical protein
VVEIGGLPLWIYFLLGAAVAVIILVTGMPSGVWIVLPAATGEWLALRKRREPE